MKALILKIGGHRIAIDWRLGNQALFNALEKAIIKQCGDHIASDVERHAEL
jgi:hypothetical protein